MLIFKATISSENVQQFQDGCTMGFDYIELLAVTVNHDRAKRIKSRERKENGSKIMHNHSFTPAYIYFGGVIVSVKPTIFLCRVKSFGHHDSSKNNSTAGFLFM